MVTVTMPGMITATIMAGIIMAAETTMTVDTMILNLTGRKNSGKTGSQVSVSAADVRMAGISQITAQRKHHQCQLEIPGQRKGVNIPQPVCQALPEGRGAATIQSHPREHRAELKVR